MNGSFLIVAMAGLLVSLVSITSTYQAREFPPAARRAAAQVGLYRSFMLVSSLYVRANPTYAGTITWSMLASASTTPDSMKNISISDAWKAVADGTGNFVLCTPMDEGAVGAVGQMMQKANPLTTVTIAGQDYIWTGTPASAAANVTQCQ